MCLLETAALQDTFTVVVFVTSPCCHCRCHYYHYSTFVAHFVAVLVFVVFRHSVSFLFHSAVEEDRSSQTVGHMTGPYAAL